MMKLRTGSRRGSNILLIVAAFFILGNAAANAATVAVANLRLFPDTPNDGIQEIQIVNMTGAGGCTAEYLACDNLALTNWQLSVAYSGTYYNGTGPSLASPFVRAWRSAADDILPAMGIKLDFDLCQGVSLGDCATSTTAISKILFTGTISQSKFTIYDSTSSGAGPTFFSNPAFSASLSIPGSYPADYGDSIDVSVTDVPSTPELPSGLLLMSGILLTALAHGSTHSSGFLKRRFNTNKAL